VWLALLQLFAPMIFVLGTIYVLGSVLPIARRWARSSIFAVVWLIVAWYLQWRLFDTMLPAKGEWYEVTWLWLCFTIELLAIADQLRAPRKIATSADLCESELWQQDSRVGTMVPPVFGRGDEHLGRSGRPLSLCAPKGPVPTSPPEVGTILRHQTWAWPIFELTEAF
jgi:hypothetical protein